MKTVAAIIEDVMPKKQAIYSSRTADKFVVRFLDGMRTAIAVVARKNHRSMNSEVISCLDMHLRLDELGLSDYVKQLSEGKIVPEGVNIDPAALAAVRETQTGEVAQFRAGDPIMHDGSPWIIAKLTVRGGNVYAKIEREDPADASKTASTEVRYSQLKPFLV